MLLYLFSDNSSGLVWELFEDCLSQKLWWKFSVSPARFGELQSDSGQTQGDYSGHWYDFQHNNLILVVDLIEILGFQGMVWLSDLMIGVLTFLLYMITQLCHAKKLFFAQITVKF